MTHSRQRSSSVNQRAQLANAYQELGRELGSEKIRVVGNYTLGKVIGTYGKVRLGTHRITSTRVAIKQIPKAMSAQLTREIHHHRQLHHPHVTQLYEVIATESSIWLVTELCTGGELFDYLVEKGRLSERETRMLFGQLCLAVEYIHEKGVVHRDLKLENVLLDEYCHVKLGDFGFTREYEAGRLLDTFCGTTGYASPEMLLGNKYSGREVDIWSLGVILYSLLCGGLPFDDDDEIIMRNRVIHGVYPEPDWLSEDARDLIRHILVKKPEARYSVKQILSHRWFKKPFPDEDPVHGLSELDTRELVASPPPMESAPGYTVATTPAPTAGAEVIASPNFSSPSHKSDASVPSSLSDHSRHSTTDLESEPTTPDVTDQGDDHIADSMIPTGRIRIGPLQRMGSQATIKNPATLDQTPKGASTQAKQNLSVLEEEPSLPSPLLSSSTFHSRTPVRTKRRSVSSAFSAPPSPVVPPGALDAPDFLSMLEYPHPVVFTSALERRLLNSLSELGIDTGQMVHSVLTNACDSSAAIWWMLKRKAERREESATVGETTTKVPEAAQPEAKEAKDNGLQLETSSQLSVTAPSDESIIIPAHLQPALVSTSISAPELYLRAATPQTPPPGTPPAAERSPARSSPAPTEPSDKSKNKDGRGRSGSITMLQRASTVLGAAGLGRKKSGDIMRDDALKLTKAVLDKGKSPEQMPVPLPQIPVADTDALGARQSPENSHAFMARAPDLLISSTPVPSPAEDVLAPLPNLESGRRGFMSAIRTWWQDDRRKRKGDSMGDVLGAYRAVQKRKPTGLSSKPAGTLTPRRPSGPSRRSSSVPSRRSSIASINVNNDVIAGVLSPDQYSAVNWQRGEPSRRSFTPTSDRGDFMSSRPASIRSMSYNTPLKRPRHGRQGSSSSIGSASRMRASQSPLQQYHRRAGSGSSIKVIRQTRTVSVPPNAHKRSDSATSSIQSVRTPSRPSSFYATNSMLLEEPELEEPNESEDASGVMVSPVEPVPLSAVTSACSIEHERRATYTVLVAHKARPSHGPPSATPLAAAHRSSWRSSWGQEPPGWANRAIEAPASPPDKGRVKKPLRDVFVGKYGGTSSGEEDEWVDEDDDPHYAGGLGQKMSTASPPAEIVDIFPDSPLPFRRQLQTDPSVSRRSRAGGKGRPGNGQARTNTSISQVDTPAMKGEAHMGGMAARGRRQAPTSRIGATLRAPIEEEEEEE